MHADGLNEWGMLKALSACSLFISLSLSNQWTGCNQTLHWSEREREKDIYIYIYYTYIYIYIYIKRWRENEREKKRQGGREKKR